MSDIKQTRRRGVAYQQSDAPAPHPTIGQKSFREAFKALQERRAAEGKLVLQSMYNGGKK
jgi:hypothetical protein